MFDEDAFNREVRRRNSFTSPTAFDIDFYDEDNKYVWDCWNADYCKDYRANEFKFHCLRGAIGERCPYEEKLSIRAEAKEKGFIFPNK